MAKVQISLLNPKMIEIKYADESSNSYIRFQEQETNIWLPIERLSTDKYDDDAICAYTFEPEKDFPDDKGLYPRGGWSILEAKIKKDHYEWIEEVRAQKGPQKVKVNLEERMYGPSKALIDFLETLFE